MSIKFKEMVSAATLTGSAVSLYTAPTLTSASIQAAACYNPTGAAVTLNVYKVPSAGAAGNSTLICTRSVPSGFTIQAIELINHKLESGSSIFAMGSGLTLNVSGVEYIPE